MSLNTAIQRAEMGSFVNHAEPAVSVCSPTNFGWVSNIAFKARTRNVFTLANDRCGWWLERAAHCSGQHTVAVMQSHDLTVLIVKPRCAADAAQITATLNANLAQSKISRQWLVVAA